MSGELFEFSTGYRWEKLSADTLELFHEWYRAGKLGFMDLPVQRELHSVTMQKAQDYSGSFQTLFVAGIGGSSLGLKAVLSALSPDGERVCLLDTPDSGVISRAVEKRKDQSCALCVITKSGGTAETLAIFMELRKLLGDVPVIAITDPVKGSLRKLAGQRGWDTLPVPPSVGGRFSVLSPVGMFPAAFQGVDTGELLRGAASVRKDFLENGADSLAGSISGAFLSRFMSHPVHVFMPYTDLLYQTAQWFSQLWAESLGKAMDLNGSRVNTGQTPLACRGPADQHSLVQLFMEGPPDKTVTIITDGYQGKGKASQGEFDHVPSMAYLQGRSPDELRAAEAGATADALSERGVPVSRIALPGVSECCLGQMLMALEISTVLCGLALNVDPLDQPGVERGKILTYKAMGREGF